MSAGDKVVRRLPADLDKEVRALASELGVSADEAVAKLVKTGLGRRRALATYASAKGAKKGKGKKRK